MPPREVLNLVVREHLALCMEQGMTASAALRDLGTTEERLANPRGRTHWNGYAAMMSRAMRALGGPEAMAEIGSAWVETSRALALVGALSPSARHLLGTLCGRVLPTAYANVGFSARAVDPATVFVGIALPRPSEGGLALLHTVGGMLRAFPRLVGETRTAVRAELAPRGARFVVTCATRPKERDPAAASTEDLEAMLALAHDDLFLVEQAQRLGAPFAAETRFEGLVHRLRTVLRDRFACEGFVLCAPPVELRSGPSPGPRTCRRRLVALGRDVGLVETPALGLSDDGTAPLWDALVVWLALGVERCLDAQSGHTRPGPRNPSARLAAQYGLTPREASVVKLCAEGRTNKEIALTLGLTERTVETHLSNVFRKTGVPNRASLVSAYFTTAGGPRRA